MSSEASPDRKQPQSKLALVIATSLGLGYLPIAPGTWGSAGGVALAAAIAAITAARGSAPILLLETVATILVAVAGVWVASRAAAIAGEHDPQFVVIDEVSGQMIALVLGLSLRASSTPAPGSLADRIAFVLASDLLNWKYVFAGFILFRVFDVWKPFPARQAESLPSGLGIMADDWIAGVYAALVLWLAQRLGL